MKKLVIGLVLTGTVLFSGVCFAEDAVFSKAYARWVDPAGEWTQVEQNFYRSDVYIEGSESSDFAHYYLDTVIGESRCSWNEWADPMRLSKIYGRIERPNTSLQYYPSPDWETLTINSGQSMDTTTYISGDGNRRYASNVYYSTPAPDSWWFDLVFVSDPGGNRAFNFWPYCDDL